MPNRQGVKNRVEKDKVKGAAQYYVINEDNNLPDAGTSPEPGADKVAATGTGEGTPPGTPPDTPPLPFTDTGTGTGTSPLIKPTDVYYRMIGYFIEHQRKFIKSKAKHYKVTEAEIMRIAVEELMKSGKI